MIPSDFGIFYINTLIVTRNYLLHTAFAYIRNYSTFIVLTRTN